MPFPSDTQDFKMPFNRLFADRQLISYVFPFGFRVGFYNLYDSFIKV